MKEKGYIQVYTGNGKGKTTASLGLALRSAGAGYKVFIGQFLKSGDYSEIGALKRFDDLITVKQFGAPRFIKDKVHDEDRLLAEKGVAQLCRILDSEEYDVVIAEELNVAVYLGVIPLEDALYLMSRKGENTELIITGRYAPEEIIARADLVTEMTEIKHYYNEGVSARTGIEK
ncbi:MAG: cob(I)yrinic acid a,c-diamide adenosyltransferase [Spirochaetales bacterium]|nr:cob(I)yrinic acid a,c-diamide adenosyltransferase [Spirochaetales bacterium]